MPDLAATIADVVGVDRSRRRAWTGNGRSHVEVRGLHLVQGEELSRDLETALEALPSVSWARVNGVLGRVVVDHGDDPDAVDLVLSVIEAVEATHEVHGEPFPPRPDHPADREPVARDLLGIAANMAGTGLAVVGRLTRVVRLPPEVAAVIPALQAQPRLRNLAERVLGPVGADLGLGLLNAAAHGLSQGPLGLVVDSAARGLSVAERLATIAIWERREPSLAGDPSGPGAPRRPDGPRPEPRPSGPAARYAERAGIGMLAAGGATLAATLDARRAVAVALAGTPKAATTGVEAYAASLGRALAERDILCLNSRVLRRLDSIDSYLIEEGLLLAEHAEVAETTVLDGDPDAAHRAVRALFDPCDPQRRGEDGPWLLGPLPPTEVLRDAEVASQLGLFDDGRLVAHVRWRPAPAPGAGELVASARDAGATVAIAGHDLELAHRLGAHLLLDGGERLTDSVRLLQKDGGAVALVAGDHHEGHAAADCGIGVPLDGRTPWTADLVCGPGLGDAVVLVDAIGVAQAVSHQSAALALGGSALAGLLSLSRRSAGAGSSIAAVNAAAAASLANGARAGTQAGAVEIHLAQPAPPWHELEAREVLRRLGSSPDGLTAGEAERRLDALDPTGEHRSVSFAEAFLDELAGPMTPVLAVGATLSAALGESADAGLVGSVLGLNAVLGAVQRVRVERTIEALARIAGTEAVRVRRGGKVGPVSADELVPGDIVLFEAGTSVPADCRVLGATHLEVDESRLTGESLPVPKGVAPSYAPSVADRSSMLYEGSVVASGTGEAVVVAVGSATEAAVELDGTAKVIDGVERRLAEITRVTLPVSIAAGALVTGVSLLRGQGLRAALAPGVSLAVAAVPEGLPLLATVAQLASARRLSGRGALVRNPGAIEALGRIDVLCVDKTGTVTEGRIVLREVFDGATVRPVDDLDDQGRRIVAAGLRASPTAADGHDLPHRTDRGVVDGAEQAGIAAHLDGGEGWMPLYELPFSPDRPYHAVVGETEGRRVLSVKGAPEVVLPACDGWAHPDGRRDLDDETRAELLGRLDRLAREGNRLLAVAEREASDRDGLDEDRVERLDLLGVLLLSDPVRAEATSSMATLMAAGVRCVMVTGDHPSTAEGVAHQLGLLDGGRVVNGPEIDALSDEELEAAIDEVAVFARVTPAHKVRIVRAFQAGGRAVAMTGDGANDAPAIRLADVGIALGEHATPAARAAADLVVTDGRMETIIDAIVEGRAMWGSVRSALGILLGGNLGEIGFTVAGTIVSGRAPLAARQLLLVNLMTDVVPALAIAVRPPPSRSTVDLLREGPDVSLGRRLEREIAVRGVATAAGAGAAWTLARMTGTPTRASTIALVALVGTQLGQTMVIGRGDPLVLAAAGASMVALAGVVQLPFVSRFFGLRPLGPVGWAIATGSAGAATVGSLLLPPVLDVLDIWSDQDPEPVQHDTPVPAPDVPVRTGTSGAGTAGRHPATRG